VGRRQEEGNGCAADDPTKVWKLEELVARGEKVYAANCAGLPPGRRQGRRPDQAAGRLGRRARRRQGRRSPCCSTAPNNGAMPAWKQLSDTELAAVITYTKNNWGNKTGQAVQPAEVVAARK
jgi:cytochrome c oxidase subunit 2